jgi:hypothetical protein
MLTNIRFTAATPSWSGPDVNLTYRETSKLSVPALDLALAPCSLDFDPGLFDRTYMLFNYGELDPEAVVTPVAKDASGGKLDFALRCAAFVLKFQVEATA